MHYPRLIDIGARHLQDALKPHNGVAQKLSRQRIPAQRNKQTNRPLPPKSEYDKSLVYIVPNRPNLFLNKTFGRSFISRPNTTALLPRKVADYCN